MKPPKYMVLATDGDPPNPEEDISMHPAKNLEEAHGVSDRLQSLGATFVWGFEWDSSEKAYIYAFTWTG